jgi:O-antigen ligase
MLILRRVLAIAPCGVTALAFISPSTPLVARVVMAAAFLVTLVDSSAGLLFVAALAPLGEYLAYLAGIGGFRLADAILLAFIAAWLVQAPAADGGPRLPRYATIAGWLFGILVVSLTAGVFSQLARYPDILRANLLSLAESYFSYADPPGITQAAKMLEYLAVATAGIELIRRRPALAASLPAALAASAVVAAAMSLLLWAGVAPHDVLEREARIGYRYAAHVGDINAAGSHFVVVLCLALGMSVREAGRRRRLWLVAAAACAFGLWMTASRTAEAALAIVVPLGMGWVVTHEWSHARRSKLIGGLLGALLIAVAIAIWRIETSPTNLASGFRQQFVMSSLRMIGTHPYFGIGSGQYYRDAPLFLTPQLAWTYGFENAHNNFLQITTETGIIGFALFACWVAGSISLAVGALVRRPHDPSTGSGPSRTTSRDDWRLLGAAAGVAAFIGTCLTSHPLVVQEVSVVFFLQLAIVAALGGSSLLNRPIAEAGSPRTRRLPGPPALWTRLPAIVTVVGTVVLAIWPALTVTKPNTPVHLEEVDGFYYEYGYDEKGAPFRWTREYASVFVPATAKRVEIPVRAPAGTPPDDPVLIEIASGGMTLVRTRIRDEWRVLTVELNPPQPPLAFNRINIRTDHLTMDNGRTVGIRVAERRVARIAYDLMAAPPAEPRHP